MRCVMRTDGSSRLMHYLDNWDHGRIDIKEKLEAVVGHPSGVQLALRAVFGEWGVLPSPSKAVEAVETSAARLGARLPLGPRRQS